MRVGLPTTLLASVVCIGGMFGCAESRDSDGSSSPSSKPAISEVRLETPARKEGKELLLRAKDAYGRIKRYAGTVTLEDVAIYGRGPFTSRRELQVEMISPANLTLGGKDSNGDPYSIVANEGRARVTGPLHQSFERPADALLSLTGVSLQGSLWLPSFLLGTSWSEEILFVPDGDLLTTLAKNAELEGSEPIDGHDCWRLRCERDFLTCVVFLDKELELVRRLQLSASSAQMDKQRQNGGGGRTGEIKATRSVQDFKIDQIEFDDHR